VRLVVTDRARQDYAGLPQTVQKRVSKQLAMLLKDKRHPSLQTKKYEGGGGVFQARVDRNYRFYFEIDGDAYVILTIIKHP
jgi:mRNA-degrading endonuclease RelE of RelBE toxin-antitoxin system